MPSKKKIDELRGRVEAAEKRLRELSEEQMELPARIEQAAQEQEQRKLEAALEGGNVATVAKEGKIAELQERLDSLEYEIKAAHIQRREAYTVLLEAQAAEAAKEAKAARADLEEAQGRLKAAQEVANRASVKHYNAATYAQGLQTRLRKARSG